MKTSTGEVSVFTKVPEVEHQILKIGAALKGLTLLDYNAQVLIDHARNLAKELDKSELARKPEPA